MPSREIMAGRLREARRDSGLTLKQVERLSGFSSTHISEIERGRTTPTVDALVRIAAALGRDPCYFLEERLLEEVAVARADGDGRAVLDRAARLQPLAPGVLGGQLELSRLRIDRACEGTLDGVEPGDLCFYVTTGALRLLAEETTYELPQGGSLHARFGQVPRIVVDRAPAELLIVRAPSGLPRSDDGEAS
ncbi:MAG: helix-turn-helix domain-containing protein [Candidatus Eisenbacteria bacterium]|nr:helix-turn-helix domain-containing protein [Candidatus Eisenbacteria bacterium]